MPETAFVPEVPHARVVLSAVPVDTSALLPGDGYADYVKPFRTLEDIHVTLAVLAYLLREARQRDWPAEISERACALLLIFAELASADAKAPETHVTLGGASSWAHALYAQAGALWSRCPDDAAARRWHRDAPLFGVAAAARDKRTQRAWERLAR
jgi:hypothetical protein